MVKRAEPYVTEATLDGKTAAWLEAIQAATRPRPQLILNPDSCVLLVMDMVRYFAEPASRAYLPASEAVIPRIAGLLKAFRKGSRAVVFTRHGHDGPEDAGMLGRFFADYIRWASPDSEIIGALPPHFGEMALRKKTYDAFYGTPLEEWLKARRMRQVLITGVLTHLCCDTTARSAFVRGFEVYIAADATASSTETLHLGALTGLADGVAKVLSVREILERCQANPS